MLAVQISPRRKKYVSFTDDTHPNKGGFFCQVYDDQEMEFETDNFVVHNYLLKAGATYNDKLRIAYKIATEKVKSLYFRR